ncbi:quinol dehydrogenase periplasmic component [Anopheles sinensis]|uniref:Quinol dehydrogenase periplasmic component n=1 Tax=Anopheles sinensis TaxID=74873 RepID=A0A084WR72_ANOSI|nr:quinol dehydrogenase periplasmic component [Anopheles sinensis]
MTNGEVGPDGKALHGARECTGHILPAPRTDYAARINSPVEGRKPHHHLLGWRGKRYAWHGGRWWQIQFPSRRPSTFRYGDSSQPSSPVRTPPPPPTDAGRVDNLRLCFHFVPC